MPIMQQAALRKIEEVSIMERAVQKSGTYKQGKSMMARKKRKR